MLADAWKEFREEALGEGPHVLHRFRHYLPIPLEVAREPWIRFSVLGEEWLPPPRGWDEVLRRDEESVLRRVHRPDRGWTIEVEGRLEDRSALQVISKVRKGRFLFATIVVVESLCQVGTETCVDGLLTAEPGSAQGRFLWNSRTGPQFVKDFDAEWEHRRHCILSSAMGPRTGC